MTKNLTLKDKYLKEIKPALASEFNAENPHAIPSIKKVVVNIGIGQLSKDKAKFDQLKKDLTAITGQVPEVRGAKISIAGFNVRQGMPVGLRVTLRKDRMYSFLTRLFSTVLPRLRDFRGVSKSAFDRDGNYTLGLTEHSVFPEIDITKSGSYGVEITIVTNAKDAKKAKRLLELLGMPFEKESKG